MCIGGKIPFPNFESIEGLSIGRALIPSSSPFLKHAVNYLSLPLLRSSTNNPFCHFEISKSQSPRRTGEARIGGYQKAHTQGSGPGPRRVCKPHQASPFFPYHRALLIPALSLSPISFSPTASPDRLPLCLAQTE